MNASRGVAIVALVLACTSGVIGGAQAPASIFRFYGGDFWLNLHQFHEAMHQWDRPMQDALRNVARRSSRSVPSGLTHALIWITAGEAVRYAIPGHVPYAEANGLWKRGPLTALEPALERAWLPWLNGQGSRDTALANLLQAKAP